MIKAANLRDESKIDERPTEQQPLSPRIVLHSEEALQQVPEFNYDSGVPTP